MSLGIITVAALAAVSFTAGFIDSIAGGGGLLTLPTFLLAGLPPHNALGTNKFQSTIGTSVAVFNYIRSGRVQLRIIVSGILFILAGSFIGSRMILLFNQAIAGKIIIFLLPVGITATLIPKKKRNVRRRTYMERALYSCTGYRFPYWFLRWIFRTGNRCISCTIPSPRSQAEPH